MGGVSAIVTDLVASMKIPRRARRRPRKPAIFATVDHTVRFVRTARECVSGPFDAPATAGQMSIKGAWRDLQTARDLFDRDCIVCQHRLRGGQVLL